MTAARLNGLFRSAGMAFCLLATLMLLFIVAPTRASADSPSTDLCVGLECNVPASGTYVPEAQIDPPDVGGLDELLAQERSGFFEMPALVYRGAAQPRSVVYLSKPGAIDEMPASVQNLPAAQDFLRARDTDSNSETLIVVDYGIRVVAPAVASQASGRSERRRRARTASPSYCYARTFCLFSAEGFLGVRWEFPGAQYAGTGWYALGTNTGASQVNNRAGDTLLADHYGEGTRYCAKEESWDSSFSNNPIGNGNTSSVALLGSTPDRC